MGGQIGAWAGGGATTTLGAAQLLYGMYNQKRNKRPVYEIPQEVQQNLNQAQQEALGGLPEEQKQQYLSNLQRSSAYALGQTSSRKGGLMGIEAANDMQNQGYANMLSMDAQARQANRDKLYGLRSTMGGYKDQAFQLNKLNPYYEETARNESMMGAGMQNVSQGFQAGNTGGGGNYGSGSGKSQQVVTPASGNQYYTPNPYSQDGSGMQNYNPYSQNGSIVPDGGNPYGNIG